jgi:hypothetical protein
MMIVVVAQFRDGGYCIPGYGDRASMFLAMVIVPF